MKNPHLWSPSKFIYKKKKLVGSRNPLHLSVSSRLVADIVASYYQKYLKLYAKGNLIDLGCGNVPLYAAYKDYVESNLCVDWENSPHQNPFLDENCNLNEKLPFDSPQFDTILLSDVLEHIQDPENLWKEMERILKPGGSLILNVPFFYKIHEAPHDYFRYTEFALRRFAENNRLKVVVLAPMGGIPEILADLLGKTFYKIPLAGKSMAIMIQELCRYFLKTSTGRRLSQKTGYHFPLGYFMVAQKEV